MDKHETLSKLEKDLLNANGAARNLSEIKAYIEEYASPIERVSSLNNSLTILEKYISERYKTLAEQVKITPPGAP